MEAGTILYHRKFETLDSWKGKKLLVILNTPDIKKEEPYLMSKTTSQKDNKPLKYGCHKNWSLFCILQNNDWFKEHTWIQLDEIYSFEYKSVLVDHFKGELEVKDKLKELTLTHLKKCIKDCDDISDIHKKLILK